MIYIIEWVIKYYALIVCSYFESNYLQITMNKKFFNHCSNCPLIAFRTGIYSTYMWRTIYMYITHNLLNAYVDRELKVS